MKMGLPFLVATLILFLSFCRSGSFLFVEDPLTRVRIASRSELIICHFDTTTCAANRLNWIRQLNGSEQTVENSERTRISRDSRESRLIINNVTEEDEGAYWCTCDGEISKIVTLTVNHLPSVDPVTNQTFHIGETAFVECRSDPGEPPFPLIWTRGGNLITASSRISLNSRHQTLEIRNIQERDSGLYRCGYNTPDGFIYADIQVNVVDIPFVIEPPEPFINVRFNHSLNLTCNARMDTSLTHYWLIRESDRQDGNNLFIPHDQVLPGNYRCITSQRGMELFSHTVLVDVIGIPPVIPDNQVDFISGSSTEYEPLTFTKTFKFPLDDSNITLEWTKRKIIGEEKKVDFGSRMHYAVTGKTLTIIINSSRLRDGGFYLLNVSNQYGHIILKVTLTVRLLVRTRVEVVFPNLPCDLLQAHRSAILAQIAHAYECDICGLVRVDEETDTVRPSCEDDEEDDEDDGTNENTGLNRERRSRDNQERSIQVILLAQAPLTNTTQPLNYINVSEEVHLPVGQVCLGECSEGTPSPKVVTTPPSPLLVALVTIIATIIIVVLVLLAAFLIRSYVKCNRYKLGQCVDDEHHIGGGGEPEAVVVVDPANQVPAECTGYVRVKHTSDTLIPNDGAETPVAIIPPSPSTQPQPPTLPPPAAGPPAGNTRHKRPTSLIRSYSCPSHASPSRT